MLIYKLKIYYIKSQPCTSSGDELLAKNNSQNYNLCTLRTKSNLSVDNMYKKYLRRLPFPFCRLLDVFERAGVSIVGY